MTLMTSAAEIFDQFEASERETDRFFAELDQTTQLSAAVAQFGINPTAMVMLSARGLLLNTCLDGVAVEHIQFDGPDGVETQLALEALNDNQQTKAASWAAKILGFIKTVGGKLAEVLGKMMHKIGDLLKSAGEKVVDKSVAAGRYVKAHPVKVIVGLIASIAAVAGIMIYSASNLPGASQSQEAITAFTARLKQMVAKVPWPFGKPAVSGNTVKNLRVDVVFAPRKTMNRVPLEKLGWNQQAARAIGRQFDAASRSVKAGLTTFGTKAYETFRKYGRASFGALNKTGDVVHDLTGSRVAGHGAMFAVGALAFRLGMSVVYAVYRLFRTIVVGALSLIWNTLSAVFR